PKDLLDWLQKSPLSPLPTSSTRHPGTKNTQSPRPSSGSASYASICNICFREVDALKPEFGIGTKREFIWK
ncbi:hypothetical protein QQP08_004204, partial [Theobroma cacao]